MVTTWSDSNVYRFCKELLTGGDVVVIPQVKCIETVVGLVAFAKRKLIRSHGRREVGPSHGLGVMLLGRVGMGVSPLEEGSHELSWLSLSDGKTSWLLDLPALLNTVIHQGDEAGGNDDTVSFC